MSLSGSDIVAMTVVIVMVLGPMAAGAKKGIDEHVMRDTPVTTPSNTPVAK